MRSGGWPAGAAISTVIVIIVLALIPAIRAALRTADPSLTAAQVRDVNVLIALAVVSGLVVVALWLLWRPASTAFFKPRGFTQARPSV